MHFEILDIPKSRCWSCEAVSGGRNRILILLNFSLNSLDDIQHYPTVKCWFGNSEKGGDLILL